MQISTRKQDYIIDTLELRKQIELLNDIFTDPKIVKVSINVKYIILVVVTKYEGNE